ncbi:sensor histidine kinase [Candidatus Solincola tengchongensis]|uniref:sensor histidine kinase n=1 Tax=Candidatus Solincola tengchongensis TaxID=2900693 RepID=UPI00257B6F7E
MAKFLVTALEAALLLALALAVATARKRTRAHLYFSLFLTTVSVWLLSGFIDRLFAHPSAFFITTQYRFAYSAATFGVAFFFLFGLDFYRGLRRGGVLDLLILSSALLLFLASLTDLIIRRAEAAGGAYLVQYGSLYPLFAVYFASLGGGGLLCILLQWRHSRGMDRWRALYILIGFGLFFLLAFVFTILLPGIMTRDVTSDYTFLAVLIPAAFTTYAIMRYRLLDVRIAVRRLFAYLFSLTLLGIPLLVLFSLLHGRWPENQALDGAVSFITLAAALGLAPAAREVGYRLASRFLFTGLYDEVELLHRASETLSTPDMRTGIREATHLVCEKLGLTELTVVIPREIFTGKADWLAGTRRGEGGLATFHEISYSGSPLHRLITSPVVLEDITARRSPASIAESMKKAGLVALLPIRGSLGEVGVLLVGHKVRGAVDPVDLEFLGRFCERAGIYIENYLLSNYLLTQLEEARKAQHKIEELDSLKTDIINVTSHEFRTPITVLQGYSMVLKDRFPQLSEEKRRECLENIIQSCQRLTSLLDQFITISRFQNKEAPVSKQVIPVQAVFEDLKNELEPEQGLRVRSQTPQERVMVSTDRSYLTLLLRNILSNAIRFSPPDSPVILRADLEDDRVRISVRDFGKGMDPSEVRNIFNPFDRLEDVDKHHSGAGLGLYIVRLIADLLETEIEVDTEPGRGTEFSFRLPVWREAT